MWVLIPVLYFLALLPTLETFFFVEGYLEAGPQTPFTVSWLLVVVTLRLLWYYAPQAPWIVLFFARHAWFPRVFIIYIVGFLSFRAAGSPNPLNLAPLACFMALWVVYLLRSRRVRRTFTR
jgi:hypothetical protein